MVAPQESNADTNWTLVESKQTRKLREKVRLQHLAWFPPLPAVNEGSVTRSKETTSSKHGANKINLKKIFNKEKLSYRAPKSITIKKMKLIKRKEKNTKPEQKEIIDISSDTDTFNDLTFISEALTVDIIGIFTIETTSSSEKDLSAPSVYQRKFLNKRIREQVYSAKCAVDSFDKIKKVKDTKEPSKELNPNQTFLQNKKNYIDTKFITKAINIYKNN